MKFIIALIAIAAIWFSYTNWNTQLNTDKAVKNGTTSIKTEKTIDKVINGRENTAKDNKEMLDQM